VIGDFQKLTQKELVTINAGLKKNSRKPFPYSQRPSGIKIGNQALARIGRRNANGKRQDVGEGLKTDQRFSSA